MHTYIKRCGILKNLNGKHYYSVKLVTSSFFSMPRAAHRFKPSSLFPVRSMYTWMESSLISPTSMYVPLTYEWGGSYVGLMGKKTAVNIRHIHTFIQYIHMLGRKYPSTYEIYIHTYVHKYISTTDLIEQKAY